MKLVEKNRYFYSIEGIATENAIKEHSLGSKEIERSIRKALREELDEFINYAEPLGLVWGYGYEFKVHSDTFFNQAKESLLKLERMDGTQFFPFSRRLNLVSGKYNHRIRYNRKKLKITQAEMAERVGISVQQYYKVERGLYFNPETIASICKELSISFKFPDDVFN